MGEMLIALGVSPEQLARIIQGMEPNTSMKFVDGQWIEKIKPTSKIHPDPIDNVRLHRLHSKTNLIPLLREAVKILNKGVEPGVVHIDNRVDFYYRE